MLIISIQHLVFVIGGPDVCVDAVGFRYTKGEIISNNLTETEKLLMQSLRD
jgi:hypothetical protein